MNGNENLIDAIICLIKGYRAADAMADKKRKDAYQYLVCQSIRQYVSPSDHYHVSVRAKELWDKLTTQEIGKFFYRDMVTCDKLESPITVTKYTGAGREGEMDVLEPNGKFPFNDLFQCDHVVPVAFIFNKLMNTPVDVLSSDYVKSTLDDMHLCRITKEEDFAIGRTKNRSLSFMDTITNGAYKHIDLVEDDYLKENCYKTSHPSNDEPCEK